MNLTLSRPLVMLDLETTHVDPKAARIVEASFTRYEPLGIEVTRTRRLNPGIPIPAEATAIHGITDADVAGCPKFADVARSLLDFLDGCDLAGFNVKRFDLKVLCAEFGRCGIELPLDRAIIDVCEMFHQLHPRDLAAAANRYLVAAPLYARVCECGDWEHDHAGGGPCSTCCQSSAPYDGCEVFRPGGFERIEPHQIPTSSYAHSAAGDVAATAEVLDAMIVRHDLPRTAEAVAKAFANPEAIDLDECFLRREGEPVFAFGKHSGKPLSEVAKRDPGYLRWMLDQDFYGDAKAVVRTALEGGA